MKKLFIGCLILSCIITSNIKSGILDSVGDVFKKAGETVIHGVEKAAGKLKEGIEIAGHKIVDCSKVVGLGVATVSTQAGQEVLKDFKKSSEAVAFKSAEGVLDTTKKTVGGVMDLASKILSDLANSFKIECIRVVGKLSSINIEFKAKVLNKQIDINEKFHAKSMDDLANQVYKKILNAFGVEDIL